MNKRSISIFIRKISYLVLFALTLSSCSFNSGVKPDISVVDVKFANVSLFETSANFTVRLQNENPFDMTFSGARHNIYLNGINIGKGLVDQNFTIPKLSTITQNVTVNLSNISLVRNIQKLIDAKEFDYRIESVLFKSGGFGLSDVSITESGNFKTLY